MTENASTPEAPMFWGADAQPNGLPQPIQMRSVGLPAPDAQPVYLPVIDSRYASCKTCSLDIERRAQGEVLASIGAEYQLGGMMICGEAPGYNEVQQKKPFVGQAGRVLDWLLMRAGLDRSKLVISNAILCRPPNNDIEKHPYAVEHCNSRVFEEIEAYKPRVIVALGNQAIRALIGRAVAKTKMELGSCDVCDGKGAVTLGNATWMKETTRISRARKLSLGLDTEIPCKQCGGKGRRNYKRELHTLTVDRGVMDLAGAVIDIHADPQWDYLKPYYPHTKYIVSTYHPSFLMRERDRKKGTPGGTFFMPYALRHIQRAKRFLTQDFSYVHAPFILDASHPQAADELRTFLAPADGVVFTIDIETAPMPNAPQEFPHLFTDIEVENEDGTTSRQTLCERCNAAVGVDYPCSDSLVDEEDEGFRKRLDPLMEKIQCVGIGRSDSAEVCVLDTRDCPMTLPAMDVLQEFLEDGQRPKNFHNGAFDTAVLEARFSGLEAQPIEFQLANREPVVRVRGYTNDTMVLSKNIWPDVVKGSKDAAVGIPLDWVAHTYTDTVPWKPKKKAAKAKGGRPIFETFDDLALYNSRDVKATQDVLFEAWDEAIREKIRPEQVLVDVQLQQVAVDMQRIGLPVDRERLDALKASCRGQIDVQAAKVAELAGRPLYHPQTAPEGLKLDSPPQLQKVLFGPQSDGGWGLAPSKMNKGRNGVETPSTAFDVLQGLRKHPGVAALLEVRRLGQVLKLISSWEYMIRDGWLHPSWRAAATVTGRFSSKPNCFDGETEVLTPEGWVRFDAWTKAEKIAQWNNGVVEFVKPTEWYERRYVGSMVRLENQHIDLAVTPDHRCLLRHRKTGDLKVFPAAEYKEDWQQIHGGVYGGGAVHLEPAAVRLLCAIQADGTWIGFRVDGTSSSVEFAFTKPRKIKRLTTALETLGIPYSVTPEEYDKRGYKGTRFRFRVGVCSQVARLFGYLGKDKLFGAWLLEFDRETLDLFCEEVFHWDGCFTRMNHYASKNETNAEWFATVLSLSGKRANQRVYTPGEHGWGKLPSHQVDVTHRDYSMTTNVERQAVPFDGTVYCVSVPSSYVLVRRNKKIQVTGQCQNWPNNIPGVGNMRSIIKAPPGWLFVGSDYAALEQRIMGALTGGKLFEFVNRPDATTDDEKFNPDIDCHSFVCARVFGGRFLTPELYLKPEQLAQGPEAVAKFVKAMKKTLRNDTKRVIYARNYGSGIDTIWEIVKEEDPECPRDKIVGIVQAYDMLFPEPPKYREKKLAEASTNRVLFSPILGRRKAFPWGEVSPTDAANFPIQSAAADIVNLRTLELLKHLPKNCHLILQVHDSLTVLCPAPMAEEIKALMNQILPCYYDLGHGPMFFDAAAQVGESWDKT